jgi:predicted Fe-Mo cluster-binding NifX family protein
VSRHFGRAPYYALVDTETGEVEAEANPKACRGEHGEHGHHHGHGKGCGCHRVMDTRGLEAVVCKGMGRGALAGFAKRGVDVFVTEKETVADVLEEFRSGESTPFGADAACAGHHRH